MLRSLRIAVTVLSLTACVLLSALWARSYYRCDSFHIARKHKITSLSGKLFIDEQFRLSDTKPVVSARGLTWFVYSNRFYHAGVTPLGEGVAIPDWLPILLTTTFAATPWMKWRFSLRTLLIATTLVAVMLGIIVASI